MFKFKGISSTDMQVIIEEEEHFIARAAKRYETIEIEGRDGAIFNELGYSYVERPIYVQCLNIDKIDDILAWLDGEGEFEYKGRKTTARFYSELEPQREGYIRIIDTTFIRDPFWIKANEEFVTVKESKVTETEELKSLHVTDANKFGQLEVLGNQEQEVREGYNLLQNNLTDTTINGVTFTINEDKSVTVNGTATASIIANLTTGEFEDGNGNITNFTIPDDVSTLKLIGCPSGGSGSTYKLDLWSSRGVLKGTDYGEGTNISISSDNDRELNRARIIIYAGATVNNLTFKPMLVAGTEEKPYEQYGATPSPDYPSPVVCLGSNKNKFNKDTVSLEKFIIASNGVLGDLDTTSASDFIEVNPSSFIILSGETNNYPNGGAFYDNNKNYISGILTENIKNAYKVPEGAKYIRITTTTSLNNNIKLEELEEGDTATSYSPYEQGSTKISKINKNLFDNEFEKGTIDGNKGINADYATTQLIRTKNYTRVFAGRTYTIVNGIKNNFQKGRLYDINKNYIGASSSIVSNTDNLIKKYTPDEGVAFIRFELDFDDAETGQAVIDGEYPFAIYQDSDDTDYIEHQQTDYLLYVQQEMLKGDYFIKELDGWKEVQGWNKIILTGNENLIKSGASSSDKLIAVLAISNGIDGFGYSNYFKYSETFGIGNFRVYNNGTNLAFGFDSTEIATLEEAKSFLTEKYNAGNPVYFYYKTATPTKLACTEEQSAVLEELSNMDLFEGVNNIITAEDISLLKLKYMKITDEKINNEGNVESRPILRLEKTSTESVELTINNCRFKYNFNDEEYVEIDCEEKTALYEGLNRNRQIEIDYEFPILNVGDNDIKMHSGDCVIKVLRKDRWL